MPWILAALGLLLAQWFCGCGEPLPATPRPDAPRAVESFLEGRPSTADKLELAGRVVDASPTWGSGVRLTVDVETVDGRAVAGRLSVSMRETARRWRTGDRVRLRSRLRRVAGFGNFGELDWAAYNARRGIFATAYAWSDDDVARLPVADGIVDRLRRRFAEACERTGGQGAEILEALVIGDRTGISRETSDAVRDAGLAHFLAISGSHMALIVALVVAIVRGAASRSVWLLERFDVLRAAAVLASAAVVAYAALSGGGVSVARSVLMALAAMAALWRGRPGDDLRALGGSAMVLALAMPGVGGEAGFQLSYLAVAALILDARRRREARRSDAAAPRAHSDGARLAPAGPGEPAEGGLAGGNFFTTPEASQVEPSPTLAARARHALFEAARLTLVCWLVTSPIVAHHFQRVSLVAPLANLLAAPLVSAIVVSGIGGLAALPASDAAGTVFVAVGAALSAAVVELSRWCASLPFAATTTPAPGIGLVAVLTSLALAALLPPRPWRRGLIVALASLGCVLVAVGVHDRYRGDRLDVWFASVGQGDAAVVRLPGGRVLVVDQGPPGRGRMVVGPLLRRAWIGRVDVLVASHVQSDHSGAMPEILDEFDVGEVWIPGGPCEVPAVRGILAAARRRGVPVRRIVTGDRESPGTIEGTVTAVSGGASIAILGPASDAGACNDNDQSIVLSVGFAGRRVLFTGDIEAAGESRVATLGYLRADVLKVPHHGSRTSSSAALLDAVRPSLAVASLGLDNQFRFPAPDVLRRYDERGIRFVRTDLDGAVRLTIDADGSMQVETFRSRAVRSTAGPWR